VEKPVVARKHQISLEFGGLRLEVYFTGNFGASAIVFATARPEVELLRFDDFVDVPHYHAPGDNPDPINLDVADVGEPREFFLNYLGEKLPTVLPEIGFADIVETLDFAEIDRHLDAVRASLNTVLPDGFSRAPGTSLQDSDPERPRLRREANELIAAQTRGAQEASSPVGS
jgi:hypothetical protein